MNNFYEKKVDPMVDGLTCTAKETLRPSHPLQASEAKFEENRFAAEMSQLKRVQGVHAPLKIAMERRSVANVGHLACISTAGNTNLLDDVITGKDETIGPSDLFGKRENFEGLNMFPHVAIEKSLRDNKQ